MRPVGAEGGPSLGGADGKRCPPRFVVVTLVKLIGRVLQEVIR